jgi:CubicO group peptidase (beta-lactamase class C family)
MNTRFFIIAILFTCKALAQPAFIKDSLDLYIEREMKRWQVPGLAIAIVKDGQVVISKGYGRKQFDKPEKVDEYTLFQIASNSKAFTGTALAMLHEEKRVLLDEKVTAYLPWFKLENPDFTKMCTVRDLLCHRIGLQTFQGDFLNWGSTLSRKQIIEKLSLTPAVYPFRHTYGYCNAAYITAGEIIPAITDTTWDDFLQYRIFKPLGFTHTNSSYHAMLNDKNACIPHTLNRNKLTTMPLANIDNMGASAAINSCVADMSKWLLMQLNHGNFNGKQIVSANALKETRKSASIVGDANGGLFKSRHFITYGLGWRIYDYEARRVFEHSGGANGFVTKTEFIPEEHLGVIVYTNSDANSLYDALCKQVIEAYLNMSYRNLSLMYYERGEANRSDELKTTLIRDSLLKLQNKPTLPLVEFTGTYNNTFYGKAWIRLEKDLLKLYLENHPKNVGTIQHLMNNEFICTFSDITCGVEPIIFKIENNKIKAVTIKVNDFIDYLGYEFLKENGS